MQESAWLKALKPNLVIISQGGIGDGLSWIKLCMRTNQPFVIVTQCNSEQWWPADQVRMELAEGYSRAQKVFCVSQRNLELLRGQLGETLPHAEVVWNPFNVSTEQAPPWPRSDDGFKLACVARLDLAAKGQDLLFQVLALPRWRERPVVLNMYGTGPCQAGLRKLAENLQLNNVRFCGHVKDIRAVWSQNHLLVLPSRYEGLPLALVEAMWCGRPAVVTDIGGNAEVCLDGETGFVAAAPAVKLLEKTLESMGQAARLRAERIIPQDPARDFSQHLLEQAAG